MPLPRPEEAAREDAEKNPGAGRFRLLGVGIDPFGLDTALRIIESFPPSAKPRQIITANPLMILAAEKDAGLAAAFAAADLVVPDGAGLVLAARLRGRRLARVPGIELMDRLCAAAAEKNRSVFLLGASPGVAERAAEVLRARHPGLLIAGTRHGFFSAASPEENAVDTVRRARPDLLFVALSTPFQDAWIHKNISRLGAEVVMGVGGSFDVIAGRLRRAPAWMRGAGLEWLFRLIQEPRRWRRMLGLPLFILKVLAAPRRS